MADFYKVLKADPLGEPYTPSQPGAKPIQSYWCQVEGQEKAVMIGKQVREDGTPALYAGQHVYGDLMYAKSQKGNEYWKLKSAQVPEGITRPADSPAQAAAQAATGTPAPNASAVMPDWFMPVANQIDYIFREMKKMDADQPQPTDSEPLPVGTVLEEAHELEVSGAPLDEETANMLDDIFGKSDAAVEEAGEPEPTEDK